MKTENEQVTLSKSSKSIQDVIQRLNKDPKKQFDDEESKIDLSSHERAMLFAEVLFTGLLLIVVDILVLLLLFYFIDGNDFTFTDAFFEIALVFSTGLDDVGTFYSFEKFVVVLLILANVFILYWRINRRINHFYMNHIIQELHEIATVRVGERIPFELTGHLGTVVDSVNILIDSFLDAVREEKESERTKEEMISNLSHDVRTPLTSIIGYLGMIENGVCNDPEKMKIYASVAYNKANQMNTLVNELFEYTKVTQKQAKLHYNRFNIIEVMQQLAIDFSIEAENALMVINVDTKFESVVVEADIEKIVRVYSNLINNALKYGRDGNAISLEIAQMGEHAVIKVKNDGSKLPPEKCEHLFERFYRADEARTSGTEGSGLGLSIVKNILEMHHGSIRAYSDGEWMVFETILPLVKTVDPNHDDGCEVEE
ncbi:MAG: HAMP domain-containing histidine kinase [Lactobacillales bacterium]|jgi:signal transduction histidine kinase|nr:HAMP domain-containing histidine kinase [Lactobacillales bacterium]